MKTKNIMSNLIIAILSLTIITFPYMLETNKQYKINIIKKMFTDNLNLLLLISIVSISIYIDQSIGIMLAFLVLFMAIYIKNNEAHEGFENITVEEEGDISMRNPDLDMTTVEEEENNNSMRDPNPELLMNNVDEPFTNQTKENFIRGTIPVIPKRNMNSNDENIDYLPTKNMGNQDIYHQNTYKNTSNHPAMNSLIDNITDEETHKIEGFKSKINSRPNNQAVKLSTQDMMGCRYDSSSNPMNAMVNGPPLATCHGYDLDTLNKSGTLFYPLSF